MSATLNLQATAIHSALTASTALITALGGTAVFYDAAPDENGYPYAVYSHQAGGSANINPSDIHDDVWFVRAYALTRTTANQIDSLMDAALNKKTLTVTGYTNISTLREDDLQNFETKPDNTRVYMSGGLYRVQLDD